MVGSVPAPRTAVLADLRDRSGLLLDRGIVLFFPGPNSFTGEDVAELQIHGSRASVAAVLNALTDIEGLRPAEPGEYTRRAFENGRIDLTAVEGLSDLIRAETEAQRRQALDQADGGLNQIYQDWAKRLTHARAMIEAELDFSDEDDVPGSVAEGIWRDMISLSSEIAKHLSRARVGEIVRNGYRIALVGAPNAGKSSLLNCLARRDVAIVSDSPGTTRDIVEVRLDIGGYLVVLQDTAGLRETDNPVELEGIRRTMAAAEEADLVLELHDPHSEDALFSSPYVGTTDKLAIRTKSDLGTTPGNPLPDSAIVVSSITGYGIDTLLATISERLCVIGSGAGECLPTRDRHVYLLTACRNEIADAVRQSDAPIEVRAEHLRSAGSLLGRITGMVDVEDLLGVIFSEFCVGK